MSSTQRADISAMSVWLICAALYVVLMAIVFLYPAAIVGPMTAQGRAHELGALESVQNITLLIALILMLRLAIVAPERNLRLWAIFIALGTLFLLGEEISWGQHYFGWVTGGVFEQINDQGETNLHNTEGGWLDQKPRAILLLGMVIGTIVHPLVKHFRNGRGLFDKPWWLAPTLTSLAPVIFSQVGSLPERLDDINDSLHLWSFSAQDFTNNFRSSEMEEVFLYIFFITYTASILARLPKKAAA
jgi:hypothetical protein